jgi:hypothetical protein
MGRFGCLGGTGCSETTKIKHNTVKQEFILQAQTPTNVPASEAAAWTEDFARARAQYKDFKAESVEAFRSIVEYHDYCIEVHCQASLQRAGLAPGQLTSAPEILAHSLVNLTTYEYSNTGDLRL